MTDPDQKVVQYNFENLGPNGPGKFNFEILGPIRFSEIHGPNQKFWSRIGKIKFSDCMIRENFKILN